MENPPNTNEVSLEFLPNGPLMVRGSFLLKEKGEVVKKNGPVALCRCGHSKNKPYCDGSHKAVDFQA